MTVKKSSSWTPSRSSSESIFVATIERPAPVLEQLHSEHVQHPSSVSCCDRAMNARNGGASDRFHSGTTAEVCEAMSNEGTRNEEEV